MDLIAEDERKIVKLNIVKLDKVKGVNRNGRVGCQTARKLLPLQYALTNLPIDLNSPRTTSRSASKSTLL